MNGEQNSKMNKSWLSLPLVVILQANPFSQWQNIPHQTLVTRQGVISKPIVKQTESIEYEDIIVFSLRAVIAAFHFEPKTFMEDQKRLNRFFTSSSARQVEELLFPGSGAGLLDQNLLTQQPNDAITRAPIKIESQKPHFWQVRLPLILSDHRLIDAIVQVEINKNHMTISNFNIETSK